MNRILDKINYLVKEEKVYSIIKSRNPFKIIH